ncbi:MAG: hypothetical protein EOP47_05275 [Sphingobacteriaceae bacterium]|nr:MAG: hypothetical protein EOP47_05275 [Sphingobacteriaceae bacterium]
MLTEQEIAKLRADALKILSPIKPADENTKADEKLLFTAQRSDAGRLLPQYFLVYFLFSDLLGFRNLGRFEKVAWSFPIDFEGQAYLIEHRKFGLGIFIQNKENEDSAKIIANKITKAVKKIKPFYNHLAEEAVINSKLNIENNNQGLFSRYNYLRKLFDKQIALYIKNKDVVKTKEYFDKDGKFRSSSSSMVGFKYLHQANWLAISCIDAFYSWTEHLFIHLTIVGHQLSEGEQIIKLIEAEWKEKFRRAIPIQDKEIKLIYDELLTVRQQLRNFVAHGAFGKNGNAFHFHSKTGAVPVLLNHNQTKNRFSLSGSLSFNELAVMDLIDKFIKLLWEGPLKPAMYYTQKLGLPTILTLAKNGQYEMAMSDFSIMEHFAEHISREIDNAANMDW